MLSWKWIAPVVIALAIVVVVNVSPTKPAEAFIDEIIAALCNGGDPVEPPGQLPDGPSSGKGKSNSATRALFATGFIESTVLVAGVSLTINFDPDVPNSKFIDAGGGDVTIGGAGPGGIDLILSPGVIPDPAFPAHAVCKNLNP